MVKKDYRSDQERIDAKLLIPIIQRWKDEGNRTELLGGRISRYIRNIMAGRVKSVSARYAEEIFLLMGIEHLFRTLPTVTVSRAKKENGTVQKRELTDDQVREIRRRWAPRPSLTDLAREYHVAPSTIHRVVKRESYKDVE